MAIVQDLIQKHYDPRQKRDFHGRWVEEIAEGRQEVPPEVAFMQANFRAHLHSAVKTNVKQWDHNPFYKHQWIHVSGGTAVVQEAKGMEITVRHLDTQRLETFHINTKEIHPRPLPRPEWRDKHQVGIDGRQYGPKGLPPDLPNALETFQELINAAHDPGMNPFRSVSEAAAATHPVKDADKVGHGGKRLAFATARDASRIGITVVRAPRRVRPTLRLRAR